MSKKNLIKFIWEEMNLIQVLKAVTQWLILITMVYVAFKVTEIISILSILEKYG